MQTVWKVFSKAGWYFDNVKKVTLKNVQLQGVIGEEIVHNHCDELVVLDDEERK